MSVRGVFMIERSVVPEYARPQDYDLVWPESTADNLEREPVGFGLYPTAVLTWERITGEALRWWLSWFAPGARSQRLSNVIVPNWYTSGSVTVSGVVYPNHSLYASGSLTWPQRSGGRGHGYAGDGSGILEGRTVIEIRELGRPSL